jgi:ZIP family zinc transporter
MSPDKKSLKRMGALTGLAIGIHNVPEGLATFVATLASPAFGGALAIAIALHNIPEGVCVAMPVYYATGSRVRGFLWAFLSGISEPLGALLGWLILRDVFGPLLYGVSFGAIAGMMVYISLKELLPTALRFDKKSGLIVPVFLGLGMVVMAISLSLLLY